jgi:hypothetical protein
MKVRGRTGTNHTRTGRFLRAQQRAVSKKHEEIPAHLRLKSRIDAARIYRAIVVLIDLHDQKASQRQIDKLTNRLVQFARQRSRS